MKSTEAQRHAVSLFLLACLHNVWARGRFPGTLRSRATLQSESCLSDTGCSAGVTERPSPLVQPSSNYMNTCTPNLGHLACAEPLCCGFREHPGIAGIAARLVRGCSRLSPMTCYLQRALVTIQHTLVTLHQPVGLSLTTAQVCG